MIGMVPANIWLTPAERRGGNSVKALMVDVELTSC